MPSPRCGCLLNGWYHFHEEKFRAITEVNVRYCTRLWQISVKQPLDFYILFYAWMQFPLSETQSVGPHWRKGWQMCEMPDHEVWSTSFLQSDVTHGFVNYTCVLSPFSPLWLDFHYRTYDSTCRLLLCGSIHLSIMNMQECEWISVYTELGCQLGWSCCVSYYRANGEVGGVEVVTLVWQWIGWGRRRGEGKV